MTRKRMIIYAIAILIIVGIVIGHSKGKALDKESKAYVDQVVPLICANLNMDTMSKYASKELLSSATPEKFEITFIWFKGLKEFKEFKESSGQAYMSVGKPVTGRYTAKVEFETGPAIVHILVIKKSENWKVQSFKIQSPALKMEDLFYIEESRR